MDLARRCQVLTPTDTHWMQSAEILNRMRKQQHYDLTKIRELAFDVLIALTARTIGATVITTNGSDFQAIRSHVSFPLLCWE